MLEIFVAHQSTLLGLRMANAESPVHQFGVVREVRESFSSLRPRIAGQRIDGVSDRLAETLWLRHATSVPELVSGSRARPKRADLQNSRRQRVHIGHAAQRVDQFAATLQKQRNVFDTVFARQQRSVGNRIKRERDQHPYASTGVLDAGILDRRAG